MNLLLNEGKNKETENKEDKKELLQIAWYNHS